MEQCKVCGDYLDGNGHESATGGMVCHVCIRDERIASLKAEVAELHKGLYAATWSLNPGTSIPMSMYRDATTRADKAEAENAALRAQISALRLAIRAAYQGSCKECPIGIEVRRFAENTSHREGSGDGTAPGEVEITPFCVPGFPGAVSVQVTKKGAPDDE